MDGKQLYTVGSLVEAHGSIRMVCGYRLFDDNGLIGVGYILVPFPLGYLDENSLAMVPARDIRHVVFEGHSSEDALSFLKPLEDLVNSKIDSGALQDYYQDIKNSLINE